MEVDDTVKCFIVNHTDLNIELDLRKGGLRGIARLDGTLPPDCSSKVGLHLRGAIVHSVKVNDIKCSFSLSDPIDSVTSLAPSSRGLEVLSVVSNGASFANICELIINLPIDDKSKVAPGLSEKVRVEISYSIINSVGSLVFAPSQNSSIRSTKKRQRVVESEIVMNEDCLFEESSTVLFAATKLKPETSGTISGHGLGPRCIFPCADIFSVRSSDQAYVGTFTLAFTVSGADSSGLLSMKGDENPVKIEVIASGDSLESEIVPFFGSDSSSFARTKCWRFAIREATRPSSVGFVAGPLSPFSSIDVRLVVSTVTSATSSLFSSPPTTQRTNSGGGVSSEVHVNVAHFASATLLQSRTGVSQHAQRTRRMLVWLSEWLRARYPFKNHRNVFLPSSVLEASASLFATPTGLMPMLIGGSDYLYGDVCADIYCMAGLTLLPDSLLISNRISDPDVATHAAQAFGLASTWIGCCLRASIWQDLWLLQGLVRYVVAMYLRSFRGESDFGLWLERLCEGSARLEDEFPALQPLYPEIVEISSAGTSSLCSNSPITVQHPFRDTHVSLKSPAVCNIFAANVGETRFRNAISAIVVKSLSVTPDSTASTSNPHSRIDHGGNTRLSASIAGHEGFLSSASFFSCMKLCGGGGEKSAELIDSLASKWVFGRGIPTFIVGVQYQADSNRINITIEQVMRPGSEFFRGELPINVYERSEAGPSMPPDTWQHTVIVSRARETFSLPCHTRTQRIVGDYWGDTSVRLGKKRGRSSKKKSSETAANVGAHSALSTEGSSLDSFDADDINRSPIEWIRIDPNRSWLRRLHVSLPPCMANSQLCYDPSVASQIEAMRSMAELLCGDALAVPGGGSLPMPSAGAAFPTIEEPPLNSQDPSAPEIDTMLRADTALVQQRSLASALSRLGYYPRPANLRRPLVQFVALIVGLDLAQSKCLGSGINTKSENHVFMPSLHWRLRVAAAANFARWQSGRLPRYGKVANAATHHQTFVGLASLIALYQRLYFLIPAPASVPQGTTETTETSIRNLVESLSSSCAGDDELLKLATSGVPGEIVFVNIEGIQVQRALIRAIGSIRHPDGVAPDAAIAFLAYILKAYDSHKISSLYDDTSLLTDLIRSLGSSMIASDGARRVVRILRKNLRESSTMRQAYQPGYECSSSANVFADFFPSDPSGTLDSPSVDVYKEAWAILREQLALELLSLRYSIGLSLNNSYDSVTHGTCASACLSVLSILEARFAAPPVSASPILYSYISEIHPSGQFRIPPRLRLAAFSSLSRIILLSIPYQEEIKTQGASTEYSVKLSSNWLHQVGQLLNAAINPALSENNSELTQALMLTLFVLQSRTDLESEDVRVSNEYMYEAGFAGSASVSESGDKVIIERLRRDLRRAMLDERDTEADVRAILDGSGSSSSINQPAIQATTFITRWNFTEAAVDLGVYDLQRSGESAMSMQERRKYGTLRLAPSFRGCLSPLVQNENAVRDLELLWSLFRMSSRLPPSNLFQSTFHLIHSIFGLLPATDITTGDSFSSRESPYRAEIDKFTDSRRDAIQMIRGQARTAHLHAALSYAQGKVLQLQTFTSPSLIEEDENEEEEEEEEEEINEDVLSEDLISNGEEVPESMMNEQTLV